MTRREAILGALAGGVAASVPQPDPMAGLKCYRVDIDYHTNVWTGYDDQGRLLWRRRLVIRQGAASPTADLTLEVSLEPIYGSRA